MQHNIRIPYDAISQAEDVLIANNIMSEEQFLQVSTQIPSSILQRFGQDKKGFHFYYRSTH